LGAVPHAESEPLSIPDADLARRIAARAPGAATAEEAELYRRLAPRVRLYGLRHLRSEAAAADLAQHVLVLAIEKLRAGQVREPERIASFVLSAARLVARDLRRATARRREDPALLPGVVETLPAADAPQEPLDLDRLRRCLDALAERDRTVIVLSFYDERTSGQIAGQLGLSEGNVRVIRHRALAQLHRCLEPAPARSWS
jgi:RNA polymerase sigma-70 factor (ECF subfamily)